MDPFHREVGAFTSQLIDSAVHGFRMTHNMTSEMKWTNVSRGKLAEYKAFVDLFFDLLERSKLAFHSIVLDTSLFDHATYNAGDKELGFYKFYYQLLLHSFGGRHCRKGMEDTMYVYLDQRTSSYSLSDLREFLNSGIRKKYELHHGPFKTVEPVDSKKSQIMQFVDIIIGAIGYHRNGCHTVPGASAAKCELMQYIAQKAKLSNLGVDTPYSRRNFTIWNFRLQKK